MLSLDPILAGLHFPARASFEIAMLLFPQTANRKKTYPGLQRPGRLFSLSQFLGRQYVELKVRVSQSGAFGDRLGERPVNDVGRVQFPLRQESGPLRGCIRRDYAASKAGTGNAVTDLIFSMAKRDATFFSATVPMSFL
jgi:hypothetical protein